MPLSIQAAFQGTAAEAFQASAGQRASAHFGSAGDRLHRALGFFMRATSTRSRFCPPCPRPGWARF